MRKTLLVTGLALVAILLLFAAVSFGPPTATAAPAAAPTPLAYNNTVADAPLAVFFSRSRLTADGQQCVNLSEHDQADLQYVVDQGTVNTTTLKMRHSNDGINFVDGDTIVSANTADANQMIRVNLFGRHNCVQIDVATSSPITWTVMAVAK